MTSFGLSLRITASTLHKWYRDVLSDYASDGGASVHANDITIQTKAGKKTIEVPIFRESNFGSSMAIDEKQIGEEMYTIMSNRESTKIAMVCKSMRSEEIRQVIESHPKVSERVKSLTRDFSSMYSKVSRDTFAGAQQIIDKFHVIVNLMSAQQDVRVVYRQKELTKRRLAHNEFKKQENERLQECEESGKIFRAKKFRYQAERLSNGETILEMLQRSRYLLFKYNHQWTENQRIRASILFNNYPKIKEAYYLSCKFRDIMSKKNIGQNYLYLDKILHQWYEDVEESKIDEMLNFKSLIERNQEQVMNYFFKGETNAIAETNNSKIQKFIASNQGARDRDFFFFRLDLYFA